MIIDKIKKNLRKWSKLNKKIEELVYTCNSFARTPDHEQRLEEYTAKREKLVAKYNKNIRKYLNRVQVPTSEISVGIEVIDYASNTDTIVKKYVPLTLNTDEPPAWCQVGKIVRMPTGVVGVVCAPIKDMHPNNSKRVWIDLNNGLQYSVPVDALRPVFADVIINALSAVNPNE